MFLRASGIIRKSLAKPFGQAEQKFEKLSKQIESFESQKRSTFRDFSQESQKDSLKEVYSHPLDNSQSPVNISSIRTEELFQDLVGPEQVSAHNESFFASRKILLTYLGSFFGLSYGVNLVNMDWVSLSMVLGTLTHFVMFYFILEGRKYLVAPIQYKWYNQIADQEMDNVERGKIEDLEESTRDAIDKSKEQLEYFYLH